MLFSCNKEQQKITKTITNVEIETMLQDSILNVRALEIVEETKGCFFLTSNGLSGAVVKELKINDPKIETTNDEYVSYYPIPIAKDTLKNNFRALAITETAAYAITIGNPARLYRIGEEETKLVYTETHEKVFYDSIEFWNDNEGIAIGDPTDDCMSVIITRDGGFTWEKVPCDVLPKANEGEAAFAASDTNIAIVENHTWIATGGKSSRILYSSDKGKSWEAFETPIIQGKPTTGMYSIAFYDALHGFAIGGDYTVEEANVANKIRTSDGGKTWEIVADGKLPGYRSCVQYVPNSNGKQLVALGFKGIDYSSDAGNTWKHLSDEGFYTLRFVNDSIAFAAGKGRISKLTFK